MLTRDEENQFFRLLMKRTLGLSDDDWKNIEKAANSTNQTVEAYLTQVVRVRAKEDVDRASGAMGDSRQVRPSY